MDRIQVEVDMGTKLAVARVQMNSADLGITMCHSNPDVHDVTSCTLVIWKRDLQMESLKNRL
jgi:hypothetical protein